MVVGTEEHIVAVGVEIVEEDSVVVVDRLEVVASAVVEEAVVLM